MSYDRYEAYSKGTTVGQALDFGCLPADLLNDFEKGHLKILEPRRQEPLDLFSVKNIDDLTYTDKIVAKWVVQANVAKCGKEDSGMNKRLEESLQKHKASMRRLAKIENANKLNIKEVDNVPDSVASIRMTYKADTYAAAILWLEDTKIEWAPNPKTGMSYDRYEAYSKGTTVGQALDFGCLPADLLNDFEKGHLKILQPTRQEPLDLFSVKNIDDLTYTDKIVAKWVMQANVAKLGDGEASGGMNQRIEESLSKHKASMKRLAKIETARTLNVKEVDTIADDTGNFETPLMMARRFAANAEAKDMLKVIEEEGRKVTDFEVLQLLRLWDFRRNTSRQNVMKEGMDFVYSDTFGLVADWTGRVIPKEECKRYPEFGKVLNRWLKDSIPEELGAEFVCTSININKNYAGKLHRDGNNVGPSFIKAFGEFTGGELNYFPEDNRSCNLEVLQAEHADKSSAFDVSKGLFMFDGKRAHFVNDFQGERFTLVFFTCPRYERITDENMEYMKAANFAFPTPEKMDKLLTVLRQPKGYLSGGRKQEKLTEEQPTPSIHDAAYLYYPHDSPERNARETQVEQFWKDKGMRKPIEPGQTKGFGLKHSKRRSAGKREVKPKAVKPTIGKFGRSQRAKVQSQAAAVTTPTKARKQRRASKATPVKSEKASPVKASALSAYEALAKCTTRSKIQFKPDGKTATSHKNSYERYQKYAVAETFEQALALGASGQDILYDFQSGFVTVVGTDVPAGEVDNDNGRARKFLQHCKKRYERETGTESASASSGSNPSQTLAGHFQKSAGVEAAKRPAEAAKPTATVKASEKRARTEGTERRTIFPVIKKEKKEEVHGLNLQEFAAQWAASHGLPAAEYTENRSYQEWRQMFLLAAARETEKALQVIR